MQEKILIVDDEPYMLDFCKRVLGEDYRVETVRSGLKAIQLAQDEQFDLLLTDIKMPGIDGLETAREIKKIHPGIVCVTMTAFSTVETAIKALRLGVDEFVVKPFAPEELTRSIKRTLEKERLRRENIRLKAVDKMKAEFTKIAAHELRTPLAILLGYAIVLEEDAEGELKEHLNVISRNANRLQVLIESMLNIQYLQSGEMQLKMAPVDMNKLLIQVVKDMSIIAGKKRITLDSNIAQNLPLIQSDKQKIELIIFNLLANAIKFTKLDGKVLVEGQVIQDSLEISVIDTGIGISKEDLPKVFNRFYQADSSLSEESNGSGLGLAIVREMVKQLGGDIGVESEFGTGSKFTFILPLQFEH